MGLQNSVPCWVVGRMTDKLPFGGEVVRLGELVESSKDKNKDGLFADVYSVTNSHGFVPSQEYFNKEVYSKELRTYRVVHRNMIAYNPSRINIGSVAVQDKVDNAIVSPLYVVFSADETKVIPGYLVRFLRSKPGLDQIAQQSIGTVRSNLKFNALCKMQMPLPSLQTQVERMNKLTLVEQLADGCENYLFHLDELIKSRFVEMFGDPIEGDDWPTIELKDLCSKLGSGATPRGGKSAYKDEGIPLIRSMNVHNGAFVWKDLAYIDNEQADKLRGVTLCEGDVLINITGASVARSCILPKELTGGRVNQHVAIVRADRSRILPIFLNAVLINDSYQRFLLNGSRMAGATREAITKQDLQAMKVPTPPLAIQQKFVDFVIQVDKLRFEQLVALKKRGSQHLEYLYAKIPANIPNR